MSESYQSIMSILHTPEIIKAAEAIESYLANNPCDKETIITELNAIVMKVNKSIGIKQTLPLYNPEFEEVIEQTRQKIQEYLGIPNQEEPVVAVRKLMNILANQAGIVLPNSTGKNQKPLLQWASIHWDVLEPKLAEFVRTDNWKQKIGLQ